MKAALLIAAVLALAGLGYLLWAPTGERLSVTLQPETVKSQPWPAMATPSAEPQPQPLSREEALKQGSPLAQKLNAPGFTAQQDVEHLLEMIRQYERAMKQRRAHPIGNDMDLARVLSGRNALKITVIPPGHPALSADGHLLDRWGSPYFIHPRGQGAYEVRSAGPDKKRFTQDDAVANPARE
jgi:hypothetical protein